MQMDNNRWIKLPCGLRGTFSSNRVTDADCYEIYVHLLVDASPFDGPFLKRGQLQTTWECLAERIVRYDVETLRRRVRVLEESGHVKRSRASKWDRDGFVVTLCQYGECTAEVRQKWSVNRQVNDSYTTCKSTTESTGNDSFNELNLQDLPDSEKKIDNQIDNQVDTHLKKSRQPTKAIEERIKKKSSSVVGSRTEHDQAVVNLASHWNDHCGDATKSRIDILLKNKKRMDAITAAIDAFGIDDIYAAIDAVSRSEFLQGKSYSKDRKPFRPDLMWVLKPDNFQKISEGFYNQKSTTEKVWKVLT